MVMPREVGVVGPDVAALQRQLSNAQRQQALAQSLISSGRRPINPMEGLSHALVNFLATKKGDRAQQDINTAQEGLLREQQAQAKAKENATLEFLVSNGMDLNRATQLVAAGAGEQALAHALKPAPKPSFTQSGIPGLMVDRSDPSIQFDALAGAVSGVSPQTSPAAPQTPSAPSIADRIETPAQKRQRETEAKIAEEQRKAEADIAKEQRAAEQRVIDARTAADRKRFEGLSESEATRQSSIQQAKDFRKAFSEGGEFDSGVLSGLDMGSGASSGFGRAVADWIPGTWTDQGAFDEAFNSFAERAARAALKASGEIRPTDADVQGMKRAMFGIGRDEGVNINLLDQFIAEQEAEQAAFDELKLKFGSSVDFEDGTSVTFNE